MDSNSLAFIFDYEYGLDTLLVNARFETFKTYKNNLIKSANRLKFLIEPLLDERFDSINTLSLDDELTVKDQIGKIGVISKSLSNYLIDIDKSLKNTQNSRKILNDKIPDLKKNYKEFFLVIIHHISKFFSLRNF